MIDIQGMVDFLISSSMLNFRKVTSERVSYNIVIKFIVLFVYMGEGLLFNANVNK
jgi:hypothetical protein